MEKVATGLKPVFRREDGSCFTANDLNGILKALLQDKVQYMKGYVASHSFRSGLVSVMAHLGSEWFNGFETHLDIVKYIYI